MVSVGDYRRAARRRLPRAVFDFVDSGAGAEGTVKANEEAFAAIKLRPRHMVDVSERDQRTTVFGREIEMPVLLGPAGPARVVHRDGELAAARAADRMGTIYTLSTGASSTIEEVAAAAPNATLWFQLYLWGTRDVVKSLIDRAQASRYHALVFTIDSATPALRDRDLRNGLLAPRRRPSSYRGHARVTLVPRRDARTILNTIAHPRWLIRHYLTAPPITFRNVSDDELRLSATSWLGPSQTSKPLSASATWDEVRWIRTLWNGPLIIKGVLTAEDAALAFDHGADGVVVSNHGGRHLDGLRATVDALPEIADLAALRGKEVFIDGGVRRGIDVIRAVALGARACLIARPYFWGLAVGGEGGVVTILELLNKEIDSALGAIGRPVLRHLDRSALEFGTPAWRGTATPPPTVGNPVFGGTDG